MLERSSQLLEQRGYAILQGIFDKTSCAALIDAFENARQSETTVERATKVYAVRHALKSSAAIGEAARCDPLLKIARHVLGANARPVKAILFDKIDSANWKVAWHQDVTISVRERIDVPGFGPWSIKHNVQHVQPPAEILERMVTLRIHLDPCNSDNGALKVLPGSHRTGIRSHHEISALKSSVEPEVAEVPKGGVLVMRPLLIHSSSPSLKPSHRRVVHIDYSADDLAGGLEWYDAACRIRS